MKKIKTKLIMIICAVLSVFMCGLGTFFAIPKQVEASEISVENTASIYSPSSLTYSDTSKIDRSYYSLTDEYTFFTENQGGMGLCWAYSGLTQFENYLAVTTGELYDFSEAWASLACKVNSTDYAIGDGGNFTGIVDIIEKYGVFFEDEFPLEMVYNIDDSNYLEVYNNYKDKAHKEIFENFSYVSFYDGLSPYTASKLQYIKKYLTNYGALSIAYSDYDRVMINGHATVGNSTLQSNHAVTLIGWDDDISFVGKDGKTHTGAYIALNSWGPTTECEYIYIAYDNTCNLYSIFGLTNIKNTIKLSSSNASVQNKMVNEAKIDASLTTGTNKEKNIFNYGENIDLTYSVQNNYGSLIDVDITKNGVNVENDFSVFEFTPTSLNIQSNNSVDSGVYTLKFDVDTDNNNIADKTLYKQFTILSGADMSLVTSNGSKDVLYQYANQFASIEQENNVYGYTYNNTISYYFEFGTYSQITGIKDVSSNITTYSAYDLQLATDSNYAFGYFTFQVDTNSQKGTIISQVVFTTLNGGEVTYNLITYSMTSSDKRAYVFYNYDDGENYVSKNNSVHGYIAVGDNFSQELGEPTNSNVGRIIEGWYTDSNFENQLISLNSSLKSMNNTNYYDEKHTSQPSKYVIFAYAKWKNDVVTLTAETLIKSYGDTSNICFTGAGGGSGDFTYSLISSNLPSGVSVDLTTLQVKFAQGVYLNIGTYTINISVVDNVSLLTSDAIKKLSINPRNITYKIDNKKTVFGENLQALTGAITSGSVINNDDLQITLYCDVDISSGIGEYAITGSSSNSNYNVTFVDGVYSIVEKQIIYSISNYEGQFDGDSHGLTINIQNNNSVTIEYKLENENYSTQEISFSEFTNGKVKVYVKLSCPNYETVETEGYINILKRQITVIWTNLSFTYNQTAQKPRASVINSTYGQNVPLVVTGENTNAGNYSASVYTTNSNFEITNSTCDYSIAKATPILNSADVSFDRKTVNFAQKLSDLQLPEGYEWKNPDAEILEGEHEYQLIYTPSDTLNYTMVTDGLVVKLKKDSIALTYLYYILIALGVALLLSIIVTTIVRLQRFAYEKSVLDKPQKVKLDKPKGEQVIISFVTNAPFSIAPVKTLKRISIKLPTPERSSYKFAGWYTDKIFMHPYINNGTDNMLTLYAKWEPKN